MAAVRPAGPDPMITSFESTRPSPLEIVDGPPGFVTGVDSAGESTIVIESPPNGLGVSLMRQCYTFILIPLGGIDQHAIPERDIAEPDHIVPVRAALLEHPTISGEHGDTTVGTQRQVLCIVRIEIPPKRSHDRFD